MIDNYLSFCRQVFYMIGYYHVSGCLKVSDVPKGEDGIFNDVSFTVGDIVITVNLPDDQQPGTITIEDFVICTAPIGKLKF